MSSSATEKHYTPAEVGKMLHLSPSTVRDVFDGLPGVLVIKRPGIQGRKQPYTTLRISESALAAWYDRHASGSAGKVQPVGRRVEKTLVRRNKRSVVAFRGADGGVAE